MLARARWLRLRSGASVLRCAVSDGGATVATVWRDAATGWQWEATGARGTAKHRRAAMRAARGALETQQEIVL